MNKITNKETGFIQYMTDVDTLRFYHLNGKEKYIYEYIENENENYLGIISSTILIAGIFLLTFILLQVC